MEKAWKNRENHAKTWKKTWKTMEKHGNKHGKYMNTSKKQETAHH